MTDRVRMKSKTTMNNPLIISHAEGRPDTNTVTDGDEFSTSEDHANDLERLGYAERTSGDAADMTEAQARLAGAQTSNNDAIAGNRTDGKAPGGKIAGPAKAAT